MGLIFLEYRGDKWFTGASTTHLLMNINPNAAKIRVVKTPREEGPEWVRQAEVGFEFDVVDTCSQGYYVRAAQVIKALGLIDKAAKEWLMRYERFREMRSMLVAKQNLVLIFHPDDVEVTAEKPARVTQTALAFH
jgi:hypothetical protein